MFRLDADRPVEFCDGFRRRDFLHLGALTALGLGLPDLLRLEAKGAVDPRRQDTNCIFLSLVGGPSQLDTWDPKPNAPSAIRGPYRPLKTNVPGIEISEIFPRMARHADKFALLRSCSHEGDAGHDTGHQLMQTGRAFADGVEHPHFGCVVSQVKGARGPMPAHVVLPDANVSTGSNRPHGQSAGYLGADYEPWVLRTDGHPNWAALLDDSVRQAEAARDARLHESTFHEAYSQLTSAPARRAFELHREPAHVREKYGLNRFGQSCLLARRLVEAGVRFVTINMFESVFDELTWDIHGLRPFSPMSAYRDHVGPMFDHAYASLLEDLDERGLLANTMVVGAGEFGRTPHLNAAGGRDHWTRCYTMHLAGGPIQGGQVVGSSDAIGAEPKDRPVSPMEVAATIFHGLGIDLATELPAANGCRLPLLDPGTQPIHELLRS